MNKINILNKVDELLLQKKNEIFNTDNMDISGEKVIYYVSCSGDDSNDGLTENTPWKTIDKINAMGGKLINSVICFKRGDIFRGNITLQNGVTYTSFGKGDKPIIKGSPENGAEASKWTLIDKEKNIWKYHSLLRDVGTIIFNDGEENAVKLTPEIIETSTENGTEYKYNKAYTDLSDMQFLCVFDAEKTVKNSIFKESQGELFLRCDKGNPGEIYNSIEFNTYGYIFNGSGYYDGCNTDIVIDNLKLLYTGGHGVGCSSAKNLTVQNCEIGWIGGAVMAYSRNEKNQIFYRAGRYGNGAEVTGFCDGYTVKNCYIHDIYDAGVTHQNGRQRYTSNREYKNILYSGNIIENCCYSVEYFAHYSTDGEHTVTMKNIEISDNIMRNAGMGICEQRVTPNFIGDTDDGLQGFNMASHINGWYGSENQAEGFVIKNNIFDRAIPNEGKRRPSGIIVISAKNQDSLPEMSGNTYIHYYGKNFAYYGLNTEIFSWNCKMDEMTDEYILNHLGDKSGKAYIQKG